MRKFLGTMGLLLAARREQRLNRQIFRLEWTSGESSIECFYDLAGLCAFAERAKQGYAGFTRGWTITTQNP